MNDPEIELIGKIIEATKFGDEANLDQKAWGRIATYAAALFTQHRKAAATVDKPLLTARAPITVPPKKTRLEARRQERRAEWHVLGHRRKHRLDA